MSNEKQNKWAAEIIKKTELTDEQIDNLLRWAGPTMYAKNIMDVTIIIENRNNLANYATALGRFYQLNSDKKHAVAVAIADRLKNHTN